MGLCGEFGMLCVVEFFDVYGGDGGVGVDFGECFELGELVECGVFDVFCYYCFVYLWEVLGDFEMWIEQQWFQFGECGCQVGVMLVCFCECGVQVFVIFGQI